MAAAALSLVPPIRVTCKSYERHTRRPLDFIAARRILWSPDNESGRYELDQRSYEMSKIAKGLMKRKFLFATLLALTMFGAVYGFAATLSVSSNALSAGNATLPSCQTGSPTSSYGLAYDSTLGSTGGYKVSSVTVSGLSAPCASKTVSVVLTDASNAQLATGSATIPAGGGSVAIASLTGSAPAASVAGVQIAING
jgi:hypothetical protein